MRVTNTPVRREHFIEGGSRLSARYKSSYKASQMPQELHGQNLYNQNSTFCSRKEARVFASLVDIPRVVFELGESGIISLLKCK